MNVAGDVLAAAARVGGKTALKLDHVELAFGSLDALSARVAALLRRRGVRGDDRVGLLLPVVPELAAVLYGVLRAGAVAVLLDEGLEAEEIAARVRASRARLVMAWHARAEAAEAGARGGGAECLFVTPGEFRRMLAGVSPDHTVADRPAESVAVVAGGGGAARQFSHAELRRGAAAATARLELAEGDTVLGAAAPAPPPGLACVLHATLAQGGCVTLMPRFDAARALEVVARDAVTVLPLPARELAALADHPDHAASDLGALRLCVTEGDAVPAELVRRAEVRLAPRLIVLAGAAAPRGVAPERPAGVG